MENSQNGRNESPPIGPADGASTVSDALGRRRITIFGLPNEQLVLVALVSFFLGLPVAFLVAMLPFWEHVGHWSFVEQLNSQIAPEINRLADEYRAPGARRLPLRRLLIGSTCLVELLFLSNFVALFARRVRRHALLVWACYDRKQIFKYFGASCITFFILWYILFFDWTILSFINEPGTQGGRLDLPIVVGMPAMAVLFGRMAAIIGLGAARAASRNVRRFHSAFS